MLALGALLANAQGSFPGARRTSRVSDEVVAEESGTRQTGRTLLDFNGIVESLEPRGLVLATADGRKLEFTCTRETKYRRGDKTVKRQTLSAGLPATITGWQNDQYFLFAVRVQVGVADGQAAKPPTASSVPVAPRTDPRIEKALLVAEEVTAALASYIVRQVTTRHAGSYLRSDWRLLDVVSAEVAYENGKETYRNVRLNDKPVSQSLEQMSGLVTQGEFGNILGALFARESRADFTPGGSAKFQGRPAWRYDFTVRQPHSQWRTKVGSHALQLA